MHQPTMLRILGLLCLVFFFSHLHYHWSWNRPEDSLWMCNISTALLGAGLLIPNTLLIRMAVIWLLPGIPLWLWDMMRTGDNHFTTFFTHVGGTAVGIYALYRVRFEKKVWIYALLYALSMQLLCRWFTPPEMNVNLAHKIYPGWDQLLSHYWQYWLLTSLQTTAGLFLLAVLLERMFPREPVAQGSNSSRSPKSRRPVE